ncbi:4-hydroxyphenylacetate 3-hydroxylase N-terminal domain-containing protein [Paenibacillus validus]|uniref:Pyoverdine biosynthesis protein PvcC n=1 Tax=Paenibacillus validus TaxID=44253 RepID=A0A7X3CSR6_9BACL|nr:MULTISPECIES: 4-hydroxyphenylacetate 3-hydroxylase N-terminal domain-containing protein [Paenibacillus]MED4601053.1 4-hydroxyphenylacetate 3-hydroxylase N-terminal domain-containing protein [Paenibacillus validus]MED4607476.1 4-hydroxyphenylacetate 3-hydroxylase N-terminal domain-containing protein [Paenibacillus validus]MUG70269.1 pyoverdine biosynthesis protein PvcC [Paenibacillus validus]
MGARRGTDYIQRLKDNPPETWIGNEQVKDPTTHPLVAPAVKSIARLYDSQWEKDKRSYMLSKSPKTGDLIGTSFLVPKSKEDLVRRRLMHKDWAEETFGMMGRSTDFMSAMLTAWYIHADFFGPYADNARNYFEYVRENDLYLTHVLIDPQVDRGKAPSEQPDEFTYLGVVRETDAGIIVRGAKMLATAGPYADEMLVWPFHLRKPTEKDYKYAISFALPLNTPGVRLIARESFVRQSVFDHPLASRFDELDSVVVFDDVLVPWERVFIYQDVERVNTIWKLNSNAFTGHQSAIRLQAKLQFLAGLVMRATEMVNTNQFPHVQDMIGEITTYIELIRAAVHSSEATSEQSPDGIYLPNVTPLYAIRNSGNRWYPRVREIIQFVVAGGLMYQPASVDVFNSPIASDVRKYYRGAEVTAEEKVKLFKAAAEIAVSDFGSRHELYERFYAGDPMFLRIQTQYSGYDKREPLALVDKMLASYGIENNSKL